MEERRYNVAWENDIIARDMSIDDALIFIKALCEKYDKDRNNISILSEKQFV